jgi:hypothetical protein
MAVVVLALSFGARAANAETPREELVHAYRHLKHADGDYAGHRVAAMKEVKIAGDKLGLTLEGDLPGHEGQWESDKKMREARRLLVHARDKLEARDRDSAAASIEHAIKEIDVALKIK